MKLCFKLLLKVLIYMNIMLSISLFKWKICKKNRVQIDLYEYVIILICCSFKFIIIYLNLYSLIYDYSLIWTEGLGGSKEAYLKASDRLIHYTDGLYVLQKNFIETLLQNNDDDNGGTASSRKIFVDKMKKYVRENSLEQRVSVEVI